MSHSPRAHSCVLHPELKNTRPSLGGKYGRMFPGLLSCEVDLDSAVGLGLPSGEAVALAMGVEPLTAEECGLGPGWAAGTPLWYYVLKEAEVRAGGEHLGPVGGRIVAEVLLGLLEADPGAYRNAEPGWRPTLPSAEPGEFGMADLVLAGVGGTAGTSR